MRVESVVFLSLVLDLFAFTIPLPLFPRIIEWYTKREASDASGLLAHTLRGVSTVRGIFLQPGNNSERWDIVLLGGLMGSVFSTLQFIVSPRIGSLSDKYGRKKVLLITMVGNILSAAVWIKSTTFASYMLSRVIGGLSEGNVQLAIAILSDVTSPENRSKALAHVGIAFAVCFCIGPPIGAYFASQPVPASLSTFGLELNIYALPAILSLVLLVLETAFLMAALPETRGRAVSESTSGTDATKVKPDGKNTIDSTRDTPQLTVSEKLQKLKILRRVHFLFLAIFSGIEFTLTFLSFDLFDWTNKQNGALLGSMGVMSALLQGGYVRRAMGRTGEGVMARRGVLSCAHAMALLAIVPTRTPTTGIRFLQAASVFMAFTSATVVNSLTAGASLLCEDAVIDPATGLVKEVHPQLAKGKALGRFRSTGQLGRAIGPLLACASYWTFGPTLTYGTGAVMMFLLSEHMRPLAIKKVKQE